MLSTKWDLRFLGVIGLAIAAGFVIPWAELPTLGSSIVVPTNPTISVINSGVTGTTLNTLTKFGTAQPTVAVIAVTTDVRGIVGITTAGAGTTGFATITTSGLAPCVFDGATTANDYVVNSPTMNGNCRDSGLTTLPIPGQVIGRVLSTNGGAGTYIIDLFAPEVAYGVNGSVNMAYCTGVVTNLATVVMFPLQTVASTCQSTSSFPGPLLPTSTIRNLEVTVITAQSQTPGSGVVTAFLNGSAQSLTCTIGMASSSCFDLVHSFTNSGQLGVTFKVTSAGGTLTGAPTYVSGLSGCTTGTQVVTFSGGTSGVNPVNATGTVVIAAGAPTGAITLTAGGAGYTAATPPSAATVATCTGTAVLTGGTITVDTLSGVMITYQIF